MALSVRLLTTFISKTSPWCNTLEMCKTFVSRYCYLCASDRSTVYDAISERGGTGITIGRDFDVANDEVARRSNLRLNESNKKECSKSRERTSHVEMRRLGSERGYCAMFYTLKRGDFRLRLRYSVTQTAVCLLRNLKEQTRCES